MSTLEIPVAVTVDRVVEAIKHLPSRELDRGEKGLGQETLYPPVLGVQGTGQVPLPITV